MQTVGQLIGTWGASTWTSIIIQSAMAEPSIQRVSIALGALQRMHEFGTGCQQYALAQYVTALRMVQDSMTRLAAGPELLLLACVLFCAFECMNYHLDSAMSHLSSGLNLVLHHVVAASAKTAPHDASLRSFLLLVLRLLDNDWLCVGALPS